MPQSPLSTTISKSSLSSQKLRPRERKFIRHYMETGVLAEAVKLSGYHTINPDQQKQVGSRLLKRLRPIITDMMIDMGLDNISLIRVLREGLEATVTYSTVKDGVVHERTYPNYFVRHKYLDTAFKLSGLYAPLRIDQRNLNVEMTYTDFISEAHRQRDALSQDTEDRQGDTREETTDG